MNFLQTSYELGTNFLQTWYKLLKNFLQTSYELLTDFLQTSQELLTIIFLIEMTYHKRNHNVPSRFLLVKSPLWLSYLKIVRGFVEYPPWVQFVSVSGTLFECENCKDLCYKIFYVIVQVAWNKLILSLKNILQNSQTLQIFRNIIKTEIIYQH